MTNNDQKEDFGDIIGLVDSGFIGLIKPDLFVSCSCNYHGCGIDDGWPTDVNAKPKREDLQDWRLCVVNDNDILYLENFD